MTPLEKQIFVNEVILNQGMHKQNLYIDGYNIEDIISRKLYETNFISTSYIHAVGAPSKSHNIKTSRNLRMASCYQNGSACVLWDKNKHIMYFSDSHTRKIFEKIYIETRKLYLSNIKENYKRKMKLASTLDGSRRSTQQLVTRQFERIHKIMQQFYAFTILHNHYNTSKCIMVTHDDGRISIDFFMTKTGEAKFNVSITGENRLANVKPWNKAIDRIQKQVDLHNQVWDRHRQQEIVKKMQTTKKSVIGG